MMPFRAVYVLIALAAAIPAALPAQLLAPGKPAFTISNVRAVTENDEKLITFTVSPRLGTAANLGVVLFAPLAPDGASLKSLIIGGGGQLTFGTSRKNSESCWVMQVVARDRKEDIGPLVIQELSAKPKSDTAVRVFLTYKIYSGPSFSSTSFPTTGVIDVAIGQSGKDPLWAVVSNVVRVTLK